MWILSKQLKRSGLSHAQLESLVSQRTIALQNLSQRLLKVQDEERRSQQGKNSNCDEAIYEHID
jgi:hypothetical protein